MLSELYISNFALIENITVNFKQGLNIFTGSTGVGKSLILGALNFLLGSRTTTDIVRIKEEESLVSGIFFIKDDHIVQKISDIIDGSFDEEIIIERSLDSSGRNKCKFNNRPITVTILKEIGELLVNIHGQHEHESLINPSNQLIILDGFGKSNQHRDDFADLFKNTIEMEKRLLSLEENKDLRKREIELHQFEIKEIEEASLSPAEMESLESERKVLVNAESIQQTVSSCLENLYDQDGSIIARLRESTSDLEKIKELDDEFKDLTESCNQSIYQLEDVAQTLQHRVDNISFDPARLEEIEERLETIRRLKSKYGESIEGILKFLEESRDILEKLLKDDVDSSGLEDDLVKMKSELFQKGQKLTALRQKTAKKLSTAVKNELGDLGISNGEFNVEVSTVEAVNVNDLTLKEITSTGFNDVEFMFSSNPGEKVKPLRKVASGGEMSRVMLVLKRQLAMEDHTPVLIFDEIDSNIGGRMGKVVGEKLKSVSCHHQIVCITHLPQIASYADQHFKVNKSVKENKTYVRIDMLKDKESLEEIAEMIRGEETNSVTRKQAKEMIDDARKFLKQAKKRA